MRSAQALLPNRAYHCFSLIADKTAVKQLFRMMQKHNIKDIVSPPTPQKQRWMQIKLEKPASTSHSLHSSTVTVRTFNSTLGNILMTGPAEITHGQIGSTFITILFKIWCKVLQHKKWHRTMADYGTCGLWIINIKMNNISLGLKILIIDEP